MYPAIKDKLPPSSPTRSSPFRRVMPRHTKAYLWLTFLILTFGYMLLLDNGISLFSLLPNVGHSLGAGRNATVTNQYHKSSQTHSQYPPAKSWSQPSNSKPETTRDPRTLTFGSGDNAFTPDDVVILFKTGATSLWRRVPIHLSTSLSNKTMTPNIVFYSDQADHIAGYPIIDVLANVSSTLKASPDFELYRTLKTIPSQNLYLESTQIDGDHYLGGGWRLDKYKFLPLMAHAAAAHPGKKWYIYMEDDNYFFFHTLYNWLSTFNPSQPLYLGSPAARLGEDFAHGGSGIIISGAAMQKTFGSNPHLADDWESYAAQRCCGDQVLSHVMAVSGVPRDRRFDHTGWAGLQALQHWKMAFGHWNWCSPLLNVHKVHQADVSRLYLLEKQFQATHGEDRVMTWGSLFNLMVAGSMTEPRKLEWDNGATQRWSRSTEADQKLTDAEREKAAWYSADTCEAACKEWSMCLSWKYADDLCALSSTAVAGWPVNEGISLTSGYLLDMIEELKTKTCPDLEYGS